MFQLDLIHNQILVETNNKGSFMIDAAHPTLISALQIKSDGTYVLDAFNRIINKDGNISITQIRDVINNDHKLGMYIFLSLLSICAMIPLTIDSEFTSINNKGNIFLIKIHNSFLGENSELPLDDLRRYGIKYFDEWVEKWFKNN